MRLNHSEKGQAILEYLLILIVGVSLILAVFKLNEHFKGFAQAYLGNYFSCLIQAGEIPSLGGGDKKREEIGQSCDAQFKEFSLAHGKALKEAFAQRAKDHKNAMEKRAARSSQKIGGSRIRSIKDRSMFPRKKRQSSRSRNNKSKSDKKVSSYLSEANRSGRFAYKGVKRKRFRKRGNQIIIEEVVVLRDKKEEKERIQIISGKERKEKSQSQYIEFREISQTELENQEEANQWNIRSIFKFLIAIVFIIALFFLIGGQLLKISKDSD